MYPCSVKLYLACIKSIHGDKGYEIEAARMRRIVLAAMALAIASGEDAWMDVFDKEGLEKVMKEEHGQKISNIFDTAANIQYAPRRTLHAAMRTLTRRTCPRSRGRPPRRYTWDVENQVLCPGLDGVCEKEEL